jgi:hypothetical protein
MIVFNRAAAYSSSDHQCYARLSHHGERLPAFHLGLDAPPDGDAAVGAMLAACSAATYGPDMAAVSSDRAALLKQIDVPDDEPAAESHSGRAKLDPENGRIPPASAGSVASASADGKRRRNEGRAKKTIRGSEADAATARVGGRQRRALSRGRAGKTK